jgi:hypothetical protein
MDLKKPIKISVLYDNPEDEQLRNLGIKHEDKPIEIPMIFYSIDNVSPKGINNNNAVISSGGFNYETLLNINYLCQIIHEVQNPELYNDNGYLTQIS